MRKKESKTTKRTTIVGHRALSTAFFGALCQPELTSSQTQINTLAGGQTDPPRVLS